MVSRRFLVVISLLTTATCFFLLGTFHSRGDEALQRATYDAQLDALRAEMRHEVMRATGEDLLAAGTTGVKPDAPSAARGTQSARERIVAEIKREIQDEMGLLPVQLLRDRRSSFVELYTTDNLGKTS